MPGDRIDRFNPRAKVAGVAGVLALGAVVLNWRRIAAELRRWFRPLAPGAPRIALVTADGRIRLAGLQNGGPADRRLWFIADAASPPLDENSAPSLAIRADRAVLAYGDYEYFAGGSDARLLLLALDGLATLFFRTDNDAPRGPLPGGWWSGRDPQAPAWLLAAQAASDAEWQALHDEGPALLPPPPWELRGRFNDVSADGSVALQHFTADGGALVTGATRSEITGYGGDPSNAAPGDPEAWWSLIGPAAAGGGWDWLARGPGAPPAAYPPAPPAPPFSPSVALAGTQLLVNGVPQTHPQLAAGVLAFAAA